MTTRRIIVTGASSGIGEACVRLLRDAGWRVVGVARRQDRLDQLAAETGMEPFVADLTDSADIIRLSDWVQESGGVSALVNNAGGAFGVDSVESADPGDWRRMYEINVLAVRNLTATLLPQLRLGAGTGTADIVTITSTAAQGPYEGGGGYNAAKHAARVMMDVLRLELSGEPIRVLEIAPGFVQTEFSLNRFAGDAERAASLYEEVDGPLTAADVAESVRWVLERPGHVSIDQLTITPVAMSAVRKLHKGPLRMKTVSASV